MDKYALFIEDKRGKMELVAVADRLPTGWADDFPYGGAPNSQERGFIVVSERQARGCEDELRRKREVRELIRERRNSSV